MVSIEEMKRMLSALLDELPAPLFEGLNGGVSLLEEERPGPRAFGGLRASGNMFRTFSAAVLCSITAPLRRCSETLPVPRWRRSSARRCATSSDIILRRWRVPTTLMLRTRGGWKNTGVRMRRTEEESRRQKNEAVAVRSTTVP